MYWIFYEVVICECKHECKFQAMASIRWSYGWVAGRNMMKFWSPLYIQNQPLKLYNMLDSSVQEHYRILRGKMFQQHEISTLYCFWVALFVLICIYSRLCLLIILYVLKLIISRGIIASDLITLTILQS
ncbi:hypothetical protein V6Z11_D05G391700 [Gossypium hirsutum]